MQNDHHWLQMRNIRRMEERVRVRLRRRIVPDRSNPFQDLAEDEFFLRFRLSKECVLNLLQNITEQLPIAADARDFKDNLPGPDCSPENVKIFQENLLLSLRRL
ncbi:hypothetical protein Pcinc_031973 [Petrolisthes cinctipes]|uniref:Uncharacterized protein n=1 Tax=Petrolisthes cinctipes TaxID=88211 RepID=A0AAE1K282_PETCI|nr:hypothetical protein Pcinc_031973 [Petrolisthes cinctipes]